MKYDKEEILVLEALKQGRDDERKRILNIFKKYYGRLHWIAEHPRSETVKEVYEELVEKINHTKKPKGGENGKIRKI